MKFTGAVLLWTAFTLTGMKISLLLKKRIAVMEETVIFLNLLMSEIEFKKINIPEILYGLAGESSLDSLNFLKSFSEVDAYSDFHQRWSNIINAFPYYKSEEKDKMLQLGMFLGSSDVESQIKTIKIYVNYFDNYREKAAAEYDKCGKTSSLFGLFFGASLFVLLL